MSKSTPSLLAFLGLVAIAGYQNRARISDMLSDARQRSAPSGTDLAPAGGGFVAEIGQFFQGRSVSTALGDLVERFRAAGQGDAADSWVSDKANMPLGVDSLEAALGEETLTELAGKTGLSRAELLLRLNVDLPEVVNRFTPNGQLPTEGDVQARF
jgi:uncharacterized protein YidB (DUF937 family)